MVAVREQIDSDPENDQYELDMLTVPGVEDHRCGNTGVEEMIKQFRKEVEEEVRREPTQPFPALYLRIRSKFSQKLSADAKNLFLSQIPAYESLQTSMYRLRRKFIPAAPATQAEFDTSLDWFLCVFCFKGVSFFSLSTKNSTYLQIVVVGYWLHKMFLCLGSVVGLIFRSVPVLRFSAKKRSK